jgi:hypothetical protein
LNQLYFTFVDLAGIAVRIADEKVEEGMPRVEEPFFKLLGKDAQPFGAPLDK